MSRPRNSDALPAGDAPLIQNQQFFRAPEPNAFLASWRKHFLDQLEQHDGRREILMINAMMFGASSAEILHAIGMEAF